jgi:hypothetical protein
MNLIETYSSCVCSLFVCKKMLELELEIIRLLFLRLIVKLVRLVFEVIRKIRLFLYQIEVGIFPTNYSCLEMKFTIFAPK